MSKKKQQLIVYRRDQIVKHILDTRSRECFVKLIDSEEKEKTLEEWNAILRSLKITNIDIVI